VAVAASQLRAVTPFDFDPGRTHLVQGAWLEGIGCPTNAKVFDGTTSFTADGCPTGDPQDRGNEGLLLAKTGPTGNFASSGAILEGERGIEISELGYDIRKPTPAADPRGSHCGAGAPRFNVRTTDGDLFFIGCNSPPGEPVAMGDGWVRLRWGEGADPLLAFGPAGLEDITGREIRSISIVFDEGQDTGPDEFGLAVLTTST
jgi:hypothetical protein